LERHEIKEKRDKFIELRGVHEFSFDKCSETLDVSKPTLISWERKFNQEIYKLKRANLSLLVDSLELSIRGRLERLQKLNERLLKEIDKRDLINISEFQLIKLYLECQEKTQALIDKHNVKTGDSVETLYF
jgi:hypothetical protein